MHAPASRRGCAVLHLNVAGRLYSRSYDIFLPVLSRTCTNIFYIFPWRSANNGFKVFDKVRLIGISQFKYYSRPIHNAAFGQTFGDFVQTIAFNYPPGANTNILPEEPLQRPFVHIELAHDILNFRDFLMRDDIVNNFVDFPHMLVPLWKPLTKEVFRELYHLALIFLRKNNIFQSPAIYTKDIPKAGGSIRKASNRYFYKGVKSARFEFYAKYPSFALEKTCKLSRLYAIHSRLTLLKNQVDARIRESLLHIRLLSPEIPANNPVAFHKEAQDRKSTRLNS